MDGNGPLVVHGVHRAQELGCTVLVVHELLDEKPSVAVAVGVHGQVGRAQHGAVEGVDDPSLVVRADDESEGMANQNEAEAAADYGAQGGTLAQDSRGRRDEEEPYIVDQLLLQEDHNKLSIGKLACVP